MNLGISGKHALVTAGGRGLGLAAATTLAKEGALVAIVSRTKDSVERMIGELGGNGAGHFGLVLDLEEDEAPQRLAQELSGSFGPLDIIVHNLGGTLDINDPLCSIDAWRRVMRINVEVAVELNSLLIPGMIDRKWGRIVHVSSVAAQENQGPIPYCAAKAAVTAYARSMGRFLSPHGIVMTAVLPGAVMTNGGYWETALRDRPEHVTAYLRDRMAIHRFGRPDEIGDFIAFLCSEQASFCVGSAFLVDGGQGRSFVDSAVVT